MGFWISIFMFSILGILWVWLGWSLLTDSKSRERVIRLENSIRGTSTKITDIAHQWNKFVGLISLVAGIGCIVFVLFTLF